MVVSTDALDVLIGRYKSTRQRTEGLASKLTDEDQAIQSMPDASPTKWHLAHVTWFFETFILKSHDSEYTVFDVSFDFLYNSYYNSIGAQYPRAQRGMITRPSVNEILAYRRYVDKSVVKFLGRVETPLLERILSLLELGLNHEEQHQELMLTDILSLFSLSPLNPVYSTSSDFSLPLIEGRNSWIDIVANDYFIGADSRDFYYDNEAPKHKIYHGGAQIASQLVTNGEWLEFIADGGYENPLLWLSDGWADLAKGGRLIPQYWQKIDESYYQMTLNGLQLVNEQQPVSHVSYFEADAFARWAGVRLPTEVEWELAAAQEESSHLYGAVWQWTLSPYVAYPGFKISGGAVGEYNGKFMCNQFVLRGSSIATALGHSRITYRNFFYPHQCWQFTGLRLARDI